MCLSTVFNAHEQEQVLSSLQDKFLVYKVGEIINDQVYPLYYSREPFVPGKNTSCDQSFDKVPTYPKGFHCFRTRKDAVAYESMRLHNGLDYVVFACLAYKKDLIACGRQYILGLDALVLVFKHLTFHPKIQNAERLCAGLY